MKKGFVWIWVLILVAGCQHTRTSVSLSVDVPTKETDVTGRGSMKIAYTIESPR